MARGIRALFVAALLLLVAGASCGGGAIGDECGAEGEEGECDDGAVCGKTKEGDTNVLLCLAVCDDQADCASDEDCNGVEGTDIKGCRPSSDTTSGSGGTGGEK